MTHIKMHAFSSSLHVDIELWNKEMCHFNNALLIFDTGASVTTISEDIILGLGYNVSEGKIQKITTGSGVAYVREVIIDSIKLGNHIVNDVRVYAHTFPDESFTTGVIGLNVISMFDVNLLFSKKIIELRPIEP